MGEIDKKFIQGKLDLITRDLGRLDSFGPVLISEVAEDFVKFSAMKNICVEMIGRAIDINGFLISELAEKGADTPKTYRETFLMLVPLGALPREFAEKIAKSAGFRNAIVHEYNNLAHGFVYSNIKDIVAEYGKYAEYVVAFLKKK